MELFLCQFVISLPQPRVHFPFGREAQCSNGLLNTLALCPGAIDFPDQFAFIFRSQFLVSPTRFGWVNPSNFLITCRPWSMGDSLGVPRFGQPDYELRLFLRPPDTPLREWPGFWPSHVTLADVRA
jgi:hypothetical protein